LGVRQKNLGAFYLIGLTSGCGAFFFIKNLACGAFFSYKNLLNRLGDAIDLKFLIMSTNSLEMKLEMIPTPILSDRNEIVCTKL